MKKKTMINTLLLLVAIGGVMLYLQHNEGDKIEQTVLRVEAEKPIAHEESDMRIASYLTYYLRNEFYSLEETHFYSTVEVFNIYSVIQHMQENGAFLTNEELAVYQKQAEDQVDYEMNHVPGPAFFEDMFDTLDITRADYVSYIYDTRLSERLYEKLYNENELSPYEDMFDKYAKKHGSSLEQVIADQVQLNAKYKPIAQQPNWFPTSTGTTELLEHVDTGRQQFTPYSMYNLYADEVYANVMRFIEQQLAGAVTRLTIDEALNVVSEFKPADEAAREAQNNIRHILQLIVDNNEPFELD